MNAATVTDANRQLSLHFHSFRGYTYRAIAHIDMTGAMIQVVLVLVLILLLVTVTARFWHLLPHPVMNDLTSHRRVHLPGFEVGVVV